MEDKEVKENSFSSCVEKLEDILCKLEGGKESLENALKLYSSGVQIIRSCEKNLEAAEQKMFDISAVSSSEIKKEQEPAFSNEAG